MKRDQLEKDVGWVVKIAPPAIRLDPLGRELPSRDEDWVIVHVTDDEVRIDEATPTGLAAKLGIDAVASFTSDPSRSGPGSVRYGLLLLKEQMYIKGDQITFAPCLKPGEPVPPRPVRISELTVDTQYPVAIGLQQRLEAAGYRTRWSAVSRLARLQHEGWEVVVEPDQHGMSTSYLVVTRPENMVYVKTREPDLEALASLPYYATQAGLLSTTVDASARALVFRFDGPQNAYAFWLRTGLDRDAPLRCAIASGRTDTVVGTLTEGGRRALSPAS